MQFLYRKDHMWNSNCRLPGSDGVHVYTTLCFPRPSGGSAVYIMFLGNQMLCFGALMSESVSAYSM